MTIDLNTVIAIDCVGVVILLMIYFHFGQKKPGAYDLDDRIFSFLLFTNMGLLITDMLGWWLIGKQFTGARVFNIPYYPDLFLSPSDHVFGVANFLRA